MQSHKDLIVWQKSIQLVKEVYILSEKFPKTEAYGLASQMKRAAVSIPSNIAEGYSRKHRPEYLQFLRIALGSASELDTQCILVKELQLVDIKHLAGTKQLLQEVLRMLSKLISSLSHKPY